MSQTAKTPLRVLFVAVGDINRASARLRVHWWVPYLERAGVECKVVVFGEASTSNRKTSLPGPLSRAQRALNAQNRSLREIARHAQWADVIVIQEVLLPVRLLRGWKAAGKRIIFDFSDPVHLATSPHHRLRHRLMNRFVNQKKFEETLRSSDCVLLENDLLAELPQKNGTPSYVMRGPINTHIFKPRASREARDRKARDKVILGWTGSPNTYTYLEPILPLLAKLGEEFPQLQLNLIGSAVKPDLGRLPVEVIRWSLESEPEQVANFDIAISYHPESGWTRARGGGKMLVYMAAGLPIVSSYFGIGDQVMKPGYNGFLARTEDEWHDALGKLIQDNELRRQMSDNARRDAEECYSYEAYLPLMLALLRGETPSVDAGGTDQDASTARNSAQTASVG